MTALLPLLANDIICCNVCVLQHPSLADSFTAHQHASAAMGFQPAPDTNCPK